MKRTRRLSLVAASGFALALMATLVVGCAGWTVNVDKDLVYKMAARRVAYHIALEKPQIIEPGLEAMNVIANLDNANLAGQGLHGILAQFTDDPMLAADVELLMEAVQPPEGAEIVPEEYMATVRMVAGGMKQGLEIAKAELERLGE